MKLRRVVPATELFSTFRANVLASVPPPTMAELIPEIRRDAHTLRGFDDQAPGSVEAIFFERLKALDTTTPLSLVLFLFREPAVSDERRRRALRMIESWLVRRMILGWTTKNYNKDVPVIIARAARRHLSEQMMTLREELRSGIRLISKWPTDDEVREYLLTRNVYGYRSQKRIVMLLRAVETSLYSSWVEPVSVPSDLSVEHVMPQQWAETWPLPSSLAPEEHAEAEAARNAKLHLIGNLTLVTAAHNSALSNAAWPAKRTGLNQYGKLLLNSRLVDEHPEVFDEAAIDARCAFLADQIISIWPGPDAWAHARRAEL